MTNFLKSYFQRKRQEKQEKSQLEAQQRREAAINARKHMSNQELLDEISYNEERLKEIEFNYKILQLSGKTGSRAPLYHCLHMHSYYYIIGICEEILNSREITIK